MKWVLLLVGIATNASASLLVKKAVTPPRKFPSLADPWGSLANWPFWLGLVLYGISFLTYAAALTKLPINVAHPVMTSGAIALVAIASVAVLDESFPWTTATGVVLVMAGVALIAAKTV